ncbi:MAPEG family protein [Thauera sp. CAU 1555]|uniref:MAPEG family protein n=1 Tax=Thauera sedimentorum TaxID=2767595 RepID=A0ABR9B8P1_9RHOO|nr:MAPEG family protein [Thauera sedimentorum]MBD8502695.1 MAPEG family protein [Thauera sedimentorum]
MLIAHVTGTVSQLAVYLAWAYVGLRVAHSLIFFIYNHLILRFAVFATSNLVLLVLILYTAAPLL